MADTIVELFEEQVHRSSVRPALWRFRDGAWEEVTWKEWWDAAERIAAGLVDRGVSSGERICLLSSTRLEWVVVDMAIAMVGAVSVAVEVTVSAEELGRVCRENDARLAVAEDPIQVGKIAEAAGADPVEEILYIDADVLVDSGGRRGSELVRLDTMGIPHGVDIESLDALQARGRRKLADEPRYVSRRRRDLDPASEATVVYTAGVSARPRGVVLTHGNLVAQIEALASLRLFSSDDRQLLFLPLAQIFARILYLAALGYGFATIFGRGPDRLADDLQKTRPTLMASVPRVYEQLRDQILKRIQSRRVRSRLLPVALRVGKAVRRRLKGNESIGPVLKWEHRLLSRLLFEDVHQWLGGRMKHLISGGAPLDEEITEFFVASGVGLLEGYGLTETSGAVSFNMPDDYRIGSVGRPLPGVEVTIAEDGEVLVRGATVMRGYVGADNGELRGVDERGWLHTGDIGQFDTDGFLYLTDRKRELIVTSTGDHVVPTGLENALCDHPLVAYALVVGEGRPYLGALIALDPDAVLEFVDRKAIDGRRPLRELTSHRSLRRELRAHVEAVNRRRSTSEWICAFSVLGEFLSTRDGTLTASGRLRRSEVRRRFAAEIDALYGGGEGIERIHDGGK